MCSACHTVMKQVSRKAIEDRVRAGHLLPVSQGPAHGEFFSSHMVARQGKITCSNCHNSHGSFTEAMLRENSVNDNCYKCHAEKRGPFLWDHHPVRENCLNCHEAHGSTKQAMLKVQPPKLCAECHGFDQRHRSAGFGRTADSSSTRDASIAIRRFMARTTHRACSSSGRGAESPELRERFKGRGCDERTGEASSDLLVGAMIAAPIR